jgi:hypothetical protein
MYLIALGGLMRVEKRALYLSISILLFLRYGKSA